MEFQATLFEPAPAPGSEPGVPAPLSPDRTDLGRGAWLDVQRSWLPDADEVFATLVRGARSGARCTSASSTCPA
jgi:hypothetical protein